MNDLLRFKKNQKYLTYDFETASLCCLPGSNSPNIPWQLGWQVYEGKKLIESHEDWIWWNDLESKMGRDAAAITGFDIDEYKRRAKDPIPIYENFTKYLYDPDVINVGANIVNFDIYIFNIFSRRLGRKTNWDFTLRSLDIQILEKAKALGQKLPKIGSDEWFFNNMRLGMYHQRGLKTNLAHLCKMYGVEYNEFRHHKEALFDVELCFNVFQQQINQIDV